MTIIMTLMSIDSGHFIQPTAESLRENMAWPHFAAL